MSRMIRFSLLAVATVLVACGGSGAKIGGGKEGAAKALFSASQPASKGSSGQGLNVSGLDLRTLASAADVTGEVTANCAQGGKVKVAVDITSVGNQTGTIKYNVTYDGCSQDGANKFDGSMAMGITITGTATSATLDIHLKGKIEISGDIDDFLDADITETISATATSATSGNVTVKLNGTIKTSENSYTYANESLTISVDGKIPEDNGNS